MFGTCSVTQDPHTMSASRHGNFTPFEGIDTSDDQWEPSMHPEEHSTNIKLDEISQSISKVLEHRETWGGGNDLWIKDENIFASLRNIAENEIERFVETRSGCKSVSIVGLGPLHANTDQGICAYPDVSYSTASRSDLQDSRSL